MKVEVNIGCIRALIKTNKCSCSTIFIALYHWQRALLQVEQLVPVSCTSSQPDYPLYWCFWDEPLDATPYSSDLAPCDYWLFPKIKANECRACQAEKSRNTDCKSVLRLVEIMQRSIE